MEELKSTGKIEGMKPVDGKGLAEYLETIKQMKIPEHYYVPYNVKYSESIKLNYYAENKINYLVIEYEVPQNDDLEEAQHVKLIIAKHPNTIGNSDKLQNTLKMFFKSTQMYSTAEAVDSVSYIAALQKMGWEFTSEGIELMQVTKLQGDVELKRTQFTSAELEAFSANNQTEKNKRQHIDRTERDIIEGIKKYIVDTYKALPKGLSQELDMYKEKVEIYSSYQKEGKENRLNLLDSILRELKPIKESTPMIPLMQKSYNQNLEGYLDMIPIAARDKSLHGHFKEYMRVREVAVKEKEDNNRELPENSLAEAKLETLVTSIDNEKDEITAKRMEEIQEKVNKKVQLDKSEGIEIA